ncbi:hypothetical protein JAAARDRAFT_49552 [Jaapia argillacea MUCL 33604]|uniref:Glycoside hydrolase family 65 protein n=1 Tax=Jaapia argillacea MUCL 33604 TaxID=933084 RepID=A0A067PGB8_9AGAM|nr:hypothetical protein JAAARDRAFT_49552 [Jaapia argillacea MUCL 33604]
MILIPALTLSISLAVVYGFEPIDRYSIVTLHNPTRNASSTSTPMQVGNGDFAFGADVTGLQTFLPYAIMSNWGWKNDTLPPNKTMEDVLDYEGVSWWNHDRLVTYMFGGEPTIQQWLIANPNRASLGRTGLLFLSEDGTRENVKESDLTDAHQELDLWTGTLTSQFFWQGEEITVITYSHQTSSSISISIRSALLSQGRLGVYLDFPWNDGSNKFDAPFVGVYNATANHTTTLRTGGQYGSNVEAQIIHTQDSATFFTSVGGDPLSILRDSPSTHQYNIHPSQMTGSEFSIVVSYSFAEPSYIPSVPEVAASSLEGWADFWSSTGFVDVWTGSSDPRAEELQRRIILSRYLMRVNEAGVLPPQESGLVNNGWYGKYHFEMIFSHLGHWALWNNWDLLDRSSSIYSRYLATSIQRAQVQEHFDTGARWPKMTDPSGRSAPGTLSIDVIILQSVNWDTLGEINELLIWQQPHPLVFAEYEYRAFPTNATLDKWRDVVTATADWMADFAWYNQSTRVYDLGPPMEVVAEDTSPNVTTNPAFELAYWRLGLSLASTWMERLGEDVPDSWTTVKNNLAPLPIDNGTYSVYEGIGSDFWYTPTYTNDHPALVGLYGWLPETPGLNISMAQVTAEKVWTYWNISNCWGWDFPMLAMSAARQGQPEQAIEWLLHPLFQFDDVGMPIGGVRVPTPYFPGSGGLLYAIAMMAEGWDGSQGMAPGFPMSGWNVRVEGLTNLEKKIMILSPNKPGEIRDLLMASNMSSLKDVYPIFQIPFMNLFFQSLRHFNPMLPATTITRLVGTNVEVDILLAWVVVGY